MPTRQSKTRSLTAEEMEAMGDGAALIREHLWLSKNPPPPPHPSGRPWNMGRDLSIWKSLLFSGRKAEEINRAIQNIRGVLVNQTGTPLRMSVLYHHSCTPLFEQALSLSYKREQPKKRLPPTVRDVLREMVG